MVLIDAGAACAFRRESYGLATAVFVDAYPTTCDDFDRFAEDTGHPGQTNGGRRDPGLFARRPRAASAVTP